MALSGESSDMFCTLYTSESVLGCCHFIYHTQKNLSFINQPKELGLVQYKEMWREQYQEKYVKHGVV